ncbi:NAD(+) hydrolase sarm1 [Phlyctochytrium planicorne]|nr:NAD(+) hydrolase sarm1 [Phlyctochytrium planicorne]
MVMQMKRTIDQLTAVVNEQQALLQSRSIADASGPGAGTSVMVIHPESFESVVSILRKFLDSEQHAHAPSDRVFRSALESIDTFLTNKISTQRATLAHLQKFIADTEFAWQDHTTVADDDSDQLKQVAWSGWPVLNKVDPNHYHYDFFISYRVSSDSLLARELSLHLVGRGFKVFLDQEKLKDGEDWRKGFVRGLKRSKVVLMLVSKGCVQRMVHSNHTVDNVLLEWETAMCAQEMGFCHAVPIFVGTGTMDFSPFPRERAIIADNVEDPYTCHQSAFTTLSTVTTLKYRFDHPNPDAGVPPSLVDDLVRELDAFDELHYNLAPQRAHALFAGMGALEIFHESSFFDAPQLWADAKVKISNVSPKQLDLVRFLIEQNGFWKEFTFEGQANFQVFMSLLAVVLSKKPTSLTFKRSWEDHELSRVGSMISPCKFLQELNFEDCVINCTVLDILENMTFLTALGFTSCNFESDCDSYEEDAERFSNILDTFENLKSFRFWKCIPIDIDEDNAYFEDEVLDRSADMILQNVAGLRKLEKFDYSDSRIPEESFSALQALLENTTTLKMLELTGQTITDEMVQAFTDGFESNKTVTELVLHEISSTARNLLSIFAAIQNSNVEDIAVSGAITDTVGPGPLVQTYREYIRNNKILKKFDFFVHAEDSDLKGELSYFWEPLFENRSIKELCVSDVFVDIHEVFAQRLTAMTQLETFSINALFNKSDLDEEAFYGALFSLQSLKSFSIATASSNSSAPFIARNLKKSRIEKLYLNAIKFRQSDVLEIVEEVKKCPWFKELVLNSFCCKLEVFKAILEAMEMNPELKITVDWYDDIEALVRSKLVLPTFLKKCELEEFAVPRRKADGSVLRFFDGKVEAVQAPKQNDAVVSIHKNILQKASQLETNDKLIHTFGTVKGAVQDIVPYFKKTRTSHSQSNFALRWPIALPDACPSIFLLDKVVPDPVASFEEDVKIIRELKLRLKTFRLPKKDAWLDVDILSEVEQEEEIEGEGEEDSEDGGKKKKKDEDEWDGLVAVESENLILGQPYKLVVESVSYPRAEASNSRTLVRSVEQGSTGMLPNVVVIFLSESIFENLENDDEKLWVAIDAWEYLLQCSDDELLAVVPVFIATKSSPNEIIGKMKHLLRSSLYVLASKRVRSGTADPDRLRIDISRAFETIDQLFKLQGMTIEKVQQTNLIADKIMSVASQFLKQKERDRAAVSKAAKDYYEVISDGLETYTLDIGEDIVDSNVHALEALLQNPEFKHFNGETGPDSVTTNVEGHIVEAWKKAPSLETIYLDGFKSGSSRGCTDQAWIELSKFLKKKNLTKFVLKWTMETKKAAAQLSEALTTHPTLKILELNGFTDCFAGPLLSCMASNTTITEFTFSGYFCFYENDKLEWTDRQEMSQEGMDSLCKMIVENKTIKKLDISDTYFWEANIPRLAEALERNFVLEHLDLSLTDMDVTVLVESLQKTRLKVLILKWAIYDDNSFKALAAWLQSSSCTLEELDIQRDSSQRLASNAVFFQSLGANRSLKILNAGGHELKKKDSMDALLGSLQRNVTLKALRLETCQLSDSDSARIISTVAALRRFEEVNVNDNKSSYLTCHQVAEWIRRDDGVVKTIKFADANRGDFPPEWKQPISDAVLKNRTISELDAGDGQWPDDVDLRLQSNYYRQLTESNLEAWQWAIEKKDSSIIHHLRTLPDAEEFMRKEAARMVCWAAKAGNMEVLRFNWSNFSSILTSTAGNEALTPLGFALVHYQVDAIQFLIDRGARPIAAMPFGSPIPALYRVLGVGDHLKLADIVRQKFNSNPDEKVNERISPDFELRGTTVLHKAASNGYFRAVEYLLPIMRNPGVADEFGSTALHRAARLIKKPSDVDTNYEYSDHVKTIVVLKRSGRINFYAKDKKGRTALDIVMKTGDDAAIAAMRG